MYLRDMERSEEVEAVESEMFVQDERVYLTPSEVVHSKLVQMAPGLPISSMRHGMDTRRYRQERSFEKPRT